MKDRKCNRGWRRVGGVFMFLAVTAAAAAVVMLLWNWIIPAVTGWSTLTYWYALGLMVLCRLLFGGMGRMHPGHCGGGHGNREHFRKMHRHMHQMSRDERREFIRRRMAGFEECWGDEKPEDEDKQ